MKIIIFPMHPIPYQTPFYVEISNLNEQTHVYYLDKIGINKYFNPYFSNSIQLDYDLLKGHKHYFIKNASKNNITGFFSRINFGIFKIIFFNKFDHILVNGYQTLSSWFIFFTSYFIFNKKLLFKGETTRIKRSKIKKIIIKIFLSRFNFFLYSCVGNYEFYKSLGISDNRLIYAPCSVDYDFFLKYKLDNLINIEKFKIKFQLPKNFKIIVFVSKLIKRKNPIELLKAVKKIKNHDIVTLFVGDGPLKDEIAEYAKNHKLNIRFSGFLNQSVIGSAYLVADVYVNTSYYDASPKTLNECLCFNKPIVVSNVAGQQKDIIRENLNGFSYNQGDIKDLAKKIEKSFYLDKEKIYEHNKNQIKKTHPKVAAENIINVLKRQ